MHDKEDFRRVKNEFMKMIEKNGVDYITTYCTLSGLPLIPAYEFIKEDYPEMGEWCDANIKRLKEFYGYKD